MTHGQRMLSDEKDHLRSPGLPNMAHVEHRIDLTKIHEKYGQGEERDTRVSFLSKGMSSLNRLTKKGAKARSRCPC